MFTLPSLTKLLVLAAILLAVWFSFRFLGQLDRMRKDEARLNRGGRGRSRDRTGRAGSAEIQDMTKCRVCEAYVPATGTTSCGRADCPY